MAAKEKTITEESPVTVLTGVGAVRQRALNAMGIFTLRDLIFHFPRAYEERFRIARLVDGLDGEKHAYLLTVASAPHNVLLKRGMTLTKFRAFDESGSIEVVFFNQPYLKNLFSVGEEYRFFGKLSPVKKSFQLSSPAYEPLPKDGSELPPYVALYPLSEGLSRTVLDKLVSEALSLLLPRLSDPLPYEVRERNKLPVLSEALRAVHDPKDGAHLKMGLRRLMFDEFFMFSLSLALMRKREEKETALACTAASLSPLLALLPYELTDAQKRVTEEIRADMTRRGASGKAIPMSRILIGDVGCGKTVCAAAAILFALQSGGQAALLVPTEILARQHFSDLSPIFEGLGYKTALLLGSTSKKEREGIYNGIKSDGNDSVRLLVGTHALLSENVDFSNLALVVTDEQHRFGVMQRAAIREKGEGCHLLVMSATPIPRTLALTLYGDLDLSRIDEMPPGRQRVDTFVVNEGYRARLNAFVRKEVAGGGQVYIVCPAVEEKEAFPSEGGEVSFAALAAFEKQLYGEGIPPMKHAVSYAQELQSKTFPDLKVAFLHGKMKPSEKEKTMLAFQRGEIQILVSTTVIEVGVNVPNASLMIVENAERFGLSQLHQLRGRVGRGRRKSYCILISDSAGETARERLFAMQSTYDGYLIAERDLALRGPGDFFAAGGEGIRQSGGMSFRLAHLCEDKTLMKQGFAEGRAYAAYDPTLSLPESRLLRQEALRVLEENHSTVS